VFDCDLFVIGAGSGGVRAARLAAACGARVVVAERRYLGGTCVNVGCVPKKLFYYAGHFSQEFSDAVGYGWQSTRPPFDWSILRDNKDAEIARLNGVYEKLLINAGVDIVYGEARITTPQRVEVDGCSYRAERILIAAGGRPDIAEFPGSEYAMNSDEVFFLPQLPQRLLVIGGGYIAVEFAGIFRGLGVETDLVYRGERLLKRFDSALGDQLADEMKNQGVGLSLRCEVERIERRSDGRLEVFFSGGSSDCYDAVLSATGRRPCSDSLGLENTAVKRRADGTLVVDPFFQTAEAGIFALGDIIGTPELTPVALAQAMAFVDTQYRDRPRKVDYEKIPTAIFSQPNIATVGLSEADAREKYSDIVVFEESFRHLKHSLSGSSERTLVKLVVDSRSDRVVGAHMLGADAGEIVQGLAVAIKAGATKAIFDQTLGIHPTAAEEFVTLRSPRSDS